LSYGYSTTAIKHPVPDRVKPSFVIFDITTSSTQVQPDEVSGGNIVAKNAVENSGVCVWPV